MASENIGQTPESRNLSSIKPHEVEAYMAVPAWNVWESNVFDQVSPRYPDKKEAINAVKAKSLALSVKWGEPGYGFIHRRVMAVPTRAGEPVIPSIYYLDPVFDENSQPPLEDTSDIKPEVMLTPQDMGDILAQI
ncbi:MAG TPA: hypothetical protein VG965_05310 [Patescibacteria group bacterium]|nr:hypothetical protein [Patescibacteria group bacterium]